MTLAPNRARVQRMNTFRDLTCPKCSKTFFTLKGALSTHTRWCGDDPVARFWSRVDKSAGETACWPWLGAKHRDGYGRAHYGRDRGNKMGIAHRIAHEYAIGPIPPDRDVCHYCDNPICCNPKHLWLGTEFENMLDMRIKGRCPILALTPDQVREIRKLPATLNNVQVGKMFNVKHDAIWRLRAGKTYQWVK
jgi:hypothetical protein